MNPKWVMTLKAAGVLYDKPGKPILSSPSLFPLSCVTLRTMELFLQGVLIFGLVAVNAFFVATEYSLLSVRRSRLQQLVRLGSHRATLVQKLLAYPSRLFSGLQLGITAASLLLGWLGESMLAADVRELLDGRLKHFVGPVSHGTATIIAFLLITGLLMVLGELAPKTIGYERAEKVSLLASWPLTLYMRTVHYPVLLMDWLAIRMARGVGVTPSAGHGDTHSLEEVELIVAGIRKRGLLGEEQEGMIHSVFDLHRVLVREIMVPRPQITSLPFSKDLHFLLERIVQDQHSRVPVYEDSPDHIIGILYARDLLGVALDRLRGRIPLSDPLDLRSLLHAPMIVPEAMPLVKFLDEARRRHAQLALVVDEFGTFVGLVTIEDVLEQIVGEIQDEYDREEELIQKVGEHVLVVDAALSLRELADDYNIVLPRGEGYETLAGFVLDRMGAIPVGGESFMYEGRVYTVVEMEGLRVAKVRIEKFTGKGPRLKVAPAPSQGDSK
ncbi:MAG TPA: hemolysin family protein [Terriglobia bacterium]|nr:hemolysin family protein [Terriglobia bacterium]